MGLGSIWKNSYNLERVEIVGGLFAMVVLFWMIVNIDDVQTKSFADVYLTMIIISGFIYAGKSARISGRHFQTVGLGKNDNTAIIAVVFGVVVAMFALNATPFNTFPLGVIELLTSQIVMIAVFAAVAEEIFFRSTLIPTLVENFKSDGIGIALGSLAFGVFHWQAYGGEMSLMWMAVAFSLVAQFGNMAFKSTAFGYALHISWNYMVVTG